jgi:hypothetical protein
MKTKRNGFSKTFNKMDIFGKEITLTYQGNSKYTSAVGSVSTILCFILLVVLKSRNLIDAFTGTRVTLF